MCTSCVPLTCTVICTLLATVAHSSSLVSSHATPLYACLFSMGHQVALPLFCLCVLCQLRSTLHRLTTIAPPKEKLFAMPCKITGWYHCKTRGNIRPLCNTGRRRMVAHSLGMHPRRSFDRKTKDVCTHVIGILNPWASPRLATQQNRGRLHTFNWSVRLGFPNRKSEDVST